MADHMSIEQHLSALNRALAQLRTARGELAAVHKLGEKAINELDALNAAENSDADQVSIVESRVRGLGAKRTALRDAVSQAEEALGVAVNEAFAALDQLALEGSEIDSAAAAVMPWCKGSEKAARKAVLQLPAFAERAGMVRWLHLRREKADPDLTAPALIKFLETLDDASPVTEATA